MNAFHLPIAVALGCILSACGTPTTGGNDATVNSTDDVALQFHPDTNQTHDGHGDAAVKDVPVADAPAADSEPVGDAADASPADTSDAADADDDVIDACGAAAGAPGCPCSENSTCDSGVCLATPAGWTCAQTCTSTCAPGFKCIGLAGAGADVTLACVPLWPHLCDPCSHSAGCFGIGLTGAVCVDGGKEGSFCGSACQTAADCPTGYGCQSVKSVEGDAGTLQCVPLAGTCGCSPLAVADQLSTPCTADVKDAAGKVIGQCLGARSCQTTGLSVCSASVAQETCNGVDDDCDGLIDEGLCDDNNACTTDTCVAASLACQHTPTVGSCNADGNTCTQGDTCVGGVCTPGEYLTCDDGNPCTTDACDPASGCTATAAGGLPCTDGDLCTVGDACVASVCVPGQAKTCSDNNACTTDVCDTSTGKCANSAVAPGGPCDDGSACTLKDACVNGSCSGTGVDCDDKNPCTVDGCEPATGCTFAASVSPCDDGDACTIGDVCAAKVCVSGALKTCPDGDPCTSQSCDTASGTCVKTDSPANTSCSDGSACTAKDTCVDGQCLGQPVDCDDKNLCTLDTCSPTTGCAHDAAANPCDDGNACTSGDVCSGGQCVGVPKAIGACDDGNPCTTDTCDKVDGCVSKNNSATCDDGNPCTTGDGCVNGACVGVNGCGCQQDADCASQEDGNTCNGTLFCDKSNPGKATCAIKPGSIVTCDASGDSTCSHNVCVPLSGACTVTAFSDGKSCDADGSVCTVGDACKGGACVPGAALTCNDGNPCTADTCSDQKGCVTTPISAPCDDGSACTVGDVCVGGTCKPGTAPSCDDGSDCTADSCAPAVGCVNAPLSAATGCLDGNACTVGDHCDGDGACLAGASAQCDDGNPCTSDACDIKLGCQNAANTLPCDADGNACTVGDSCNNKVCTAGVAKVCNDQNGCTTDTCNAATGACQFVAAIGLGCDDGNTCTQNDLCDASGACKSGQASNCDDGNGCTIDACTNGVGCSHTTLSNGAACSDLSCGATTCWCQSAVCSKKPTCGDSIVDVGEQCDFGANNAAHGCSSTCQWQPVAPTVGTLIITEMNPAPSHDSSDEWFELFNNSDQPLNLAGVYFGDTQSFNGTNAPYQFPAGAVLMPKSYAIVAALQTVGGGIPADYWYGTTADAPKLNNTGDLICVSLSTACSGANLIARATYSSSKNGKSWELATSKYATAYASGSVTINAGATWCYGSLLIGKTAADYGTPGADNSDCP